MIYKDIVIENDGNDSSGRKVIKYQKCGRVPMVVTICSRGCSGSGSVMKYGDIDAMTISVRTR